MKIVALSDTHNRHDAIEDPDGDVLVHAGDITGRGRLRELEAFAAWWKELPHRHKVIIAGNHDFCFEREDEKRFAWEMLDGSHYLQDVLVTHGPPRGVLDETSAGEKVGCDDLLCRVEVVKPRLHVFGYIHEAYGVEKRGGTTFANASSCDLSYDPIHPPLFFDL